MQPCTACSLHKIAEHCVYDLTESERQPILQAEALREKDKEIDRLRHQIVSLGGPLAKEPHNGSDAKKKRKPGSTLKNGRRAGSNRQKGVSNDLDADCGFLGTPDMVNITKEVSFPPLRSSLLLTIV